MLPKLIDFGDFFLPAYGLLVTAAFLAGLWLMTRLARRDGLNPDDMVNLAVYCALAGILGGKALMLVQDFDFYRRNPGEIFSLATFQAGGIFYGGLVAALGTAWWYMRRKKLPGLRTADVFAPGVALGHAIGRLGCFAAGCCWGLECRLPWAVTFTNPDTHQMFGTPLHIPLHPAQLYQAAAEGLVALILWRRSIVPHRPGAIIGLYLVLTSAARFAIEFVRAHEAPNPFGGPLSTAQWMALGLAALGVWILRRRVAAG